MNQLPENSKEMLSSIAEHLNGNISHYTTLDHSGRTSKKIVIEYDVRTKGVSSEAKTTTPS